MESKRKLDDRNELLEYRSWSTPHTALLDTKMNCSLFKKFIVFFFKSKFQCQSTCAVKTLIQTEVMYHQNSFTHEVL